MKARIMLWAVIAVMCFIAFLAGEWRGLQKQAPLSARDLQFKGIQLPDQVEWYPPDGMSCFDDVNNQLTVCVMRNDK